jgi:N6-L-threonylcarbamoyladenine synthase
MILVGGGVSANQTFRELLSKQANIPVLFPERKYSTDNAAMIGAYASINPTPIKWNKLSANPELYFA